MNQPEWLDVLRQELEVSGRSQNQLAAELGVSPSLLSQMLRGTYPGSTEMLQISVEGILMHREVMCPIKGSIPVNECAGHQNKPFSSSNRERVKLYRACRSG
ncbi:helix-turn-helix domain-containing protein [Photobacterium nomapromontoriensis]|uniref:helix-turn-helix domain-containing protein n=1 Tax=Photobacterium nomapromontoriensis TaxID=2910237 RepID=UPI003D0B531B